MPSDHGCDAWIGRADTKEASTMPARVVTWQTRCKGVRLACQVDTYPEDADQRSGDQTAPPSPVPAWSRLAANWTHLLDKDAKHAMMLETQHGHSCRPQQQMRYTS